MMRLILHQVDQIEIDGTLFSEKSWYPFGAAIVIGWLLFSINLCIPFLVVVVVVVVVVDGVISRAN